MTRYIPAPEVFARHAASGLTKYTYDEVVAAAAECSAAEADLPRGGSARVSFDRYAPGMCPPTPDPPSESA